MSDQIDLIHQFQQFVADNPTPESITAPEISESELSETDKTETLDAAV